MNISFYLMTLLDPIVFVSSSLAIFCFAVIAISIPFYFSYDNDDIEKKIAKKSMRISVIVFIFSLIIAFITPRTNDGFIIFNIENPRK